MRGPALPVALTPPATCGSRFRSTEVVIVRKVPPISGAATGAADGEGTAVGLDEAGAAPVVGGGPLAGATPAVPQPAIPSAATPRTAPRKMRRRETRRLVQ